MLRSVKIKKSIPDNSKSENITQKLPEETSIRLSEMSEGNRLANFFQKITCSGRKLTDDESEVLIIPKVTSK